MFFVAMPALAQETGEPPAAGTTEVTYDVLNKQLEDASRKFYADYQAAREKDPSLAYDFSKHPNNVFAARFEALAKAKPGTADAVKALTLLLRIAPDQERKQAALDTLLDDTHVGLKGVRSALFNIRYAYFADRAAALRRIAEKNTHKDVKGNALLQLGWVLKQSDGKQALEVLERVQSEYGDVLYSGKRTVGEQAAAEIFEVVNLAVGKVAPDIVGEDLHGAPMKLSDFRGKVVFLDFWGDW
jgi:hypothetical protein